MSGRVQTAIRREARRVADPKLSRKIIKDIYPQVKYPPMSYRSLRRRFKNLYRGGMSLRAIKQAVVTERQRRRLRA